MYNPLRRLLKRIERKNPFLLAHHPRCAYYSHHTFELYGTHLCMGCFTVYPVGLASLSMLTLVTVLAPGLLAFDTVLFYAAGGAFATPKLVSKAFFDVQSVRARMATKALLAVGLAFLAYPIPFRPGDRLVSVLLFGGLLVPYVVYKGVTAFDDCQGCPERPDFPDCSGLEFERGYDHGSDRGGSGPDP